MYVEQSRDAHEKSSTIPELVTWSYTFIKFFIFSEYNYMANKLITSVIC